MPHVNIKVTDEGVTREQKQALIKGTTKLLVDVLNRNPQTTFVVIDEVNTDNWGIGFDQVTNLRKNTWELHNESLATITLHGDFHRRSHSGAGSR